MLSSADLVAETVAANLAVIGPGTGTPTGPVTIGDGIDSKALRAAH